MIVRVFVKVKNDILVYNDDEIPSGSVLSGEDYVVSANRVLKEMYGLRFKEHQFVLLDSSEDFSNVGLNLSYYPESYTDLEPVFRSIKKVCKNESGDLTRRFLDSEVSSLLLY